MIEQNLTITIEVPVAAFTKEGVNVALLQAALSNILRRDENRRNEGERLCFYGELFEHAMERVVSALKRYHQLRPQEGENFFVEGEAHSGGYRPIKVLIKEGT